MQGIYTNIPETNHVPREYSVSAILSLLFMVSISLVPALALLYFYVSNFRSANVRLLLLLLLLLLLFPVAMRSKAWVNGRLLSGIAGSNPTGDMYVCLL